MQQVRGAGGIGLTAAMAAVAVLLWLPAAHAQTPERESVQGAPADDAAVEAPAPNGEGVGRSGPGESGIRARWASPFQVESQGTVAPRDARTVVVRPAHPAAIAAVVDSGEVVARVRVLGDMPGLVMVGGEPPEAAADPEEETAPGGRPLSATEGSGVADMAPPAEVADVASVAREAVPATPPGEAAVTPAAAATAAITAPDDRGEADGRTHTVAYGETWYGLARRFGVAPSALADANPDVDPERLRAGAVLDVPAADDTTAAATEQRTHTISAGDTLFGLARRYGVPAAAIRSANRMTDDVVRLGQTLVIPQEEASR